MRARSTAPPARMPVSLVLVMPLLALLTACGSTCCIKLPLQSDGTMHYLILGIGMVSVPVAGDAKAVYVSRTQALGLSLSDQPGLKLGAGYSTSSTVMVNDGARDVRVEVSQRPTGPLRVDVPQAELAAITTPQEDSR